MTDFHDELREALSRKAAEAPRPGGMPEDVLRRAKRRRVANGALAGGLALALAFGGFIGVRAAMDAAAPVREEVPLGPGDETPSPEPTAAPSPEPTESPEPDPTGSPWPAPVTSCARTEAGSDAVFPDFVDLSIQEPDVVPGRASITFHFEPMAGQTEAPWHIIDFTDQLVTDGEGAPVDVQGETFVAVTFMARGVSLDGEEIVEIYTGPKEFRLDGPIMLEVEQTGDFEGMVSWGIGLSEKTCYAVDAGPDHLTITFVR
ncbi:MAG TPA: hypothetical protein VF058_02875 [Actinomycetota bacterium]